MCDSVGHALPPRERRETQITNQTIAVHPDPSSGVFTANAAWLVLAVIAFNITRAAGSVTGIGLAKATTATIRRKIVAVPARIASSARRITLHLPVSWP